MIMIILLLNRMNNQEGTKTVPLQVLKTYKKTLEEHQELLS